MESQKVAVKSADRVLDLLELLALWGREMSHIQIVEALDIPKSSLSQLLRNLTDRGYVTYNPATRSYRLGHAVAALATHTSKLSGIVDHAEPILATITERTGESCSLALLKGDQIEVAACVDSPARFRYHMRLGDLAPIYATSAGKALLAYLPAAMRDDYLQSVKLTPLTPRTHTSVAKLREELAAVKKKGVAFSREELTLGIVSIGVPVLDKSAAPLAALNIAIPTVRFDKAAEKEAIGALRAGVERLEKAMS